jgi:hypothetical protein
MKLLAAVVVLAALCCAVTAQAVPLPRARPAQAPTMPAPQASQPEEPAEPSACRLRLTPALAVAPSIPSLAGAGDCAVDDVVRLEAVVLSNKTRVAVTPPAIVRCTFAEAIVQWVREDVAPALRPLGAPLKVVDNYDSYECRGRNRVVGAKLSEHGKANALDVRSFKLANGTVVELTDQQVSKDLRMNLRKSTCARFSTVLGPGSDGYHESHVHVDLADRAGGYRLCHWEVWEPGEGPAAAVPLPPPRPASLGD